MSDNTTMTRAEKIRAAGGGPKKKRPSWLLPTAAGAAAVALIGGGAFGVRYLSHEGSGATQALPAWANVEGNSGPVVLGESKNDIPVVDLYTDFQCPACAQFSATLEPVLVELANQDKIQLRQHLMTFLDDNLKNDSSKKATNAALCAPDRAKYGSISSAIFANQPQNEGEGFADDQLDAIAKGSGMDAVELEKWRNCYKEQPYTDYLAKVQKNADNDGFKGTPTVRVDGKDMDLGKVKTLADFYQQIGVAAPSAPEAKPSPSTTGTK